MQTHRIDHVGVVVNDLAAAKAFFLAFGLEAQGEGELEAPWLDQIVGLPGAHTAFVYMHLPGGEANIELIKYIAPLDANGLQPSLANTLGLRHICFAVDDIEAQVAKLKPHGAELVGAITQYEDSYKLCYLRGPEGIILELAEKLN